MARLVNKTKELTLSSNVELAQTLWERTKGLLGRAHFESGNTLWIKPCSSIHTYFMQFPIDVAFVDKNLKVTRIKKQVSPWKLVLSTFKSDSVFEFSAGALDQNNIEIGDQLYVDC